MDPALRTSRQGVFAAGNVLHGAEQAGVAALSGRMRRRRSFATWRTAPPAERKPIVCEAPLGWIAPNVASGGRSARGRFALRAQEFPRAPRIEIVQGERALWGGRLARLMPGRSTAGRSA